MMYKTTMYYLYLCIILALVKQATPAATVSMMGLSISGNNLINQNGVEVQLRGVLKAGTEYMCTIANQTFDGPFDTPSILAMKAWGINTVRLPLNEHCWLGLPTVVWKGVNYQNDIKNYVMNLKSNNMAVIISLTRAAPSGVAPITVRSMPNADNSASFWASVAATFKTSYGYTNVLFEIYGSPWPANNVWDSNAAWTCWKNGGSSCTEGYTVQGINSLYNTIRNSPVSAQNIVILTGIANGNSLAQWLSYKPSGYNIIAGARVYSTDFCQTTSCWETYYKPVALQYPIVINEASQTICSDSFINTLTTWADNYNVSYIAAKWNTYTCSGGYGLVTDYSGTPTLFGNIYRSHILNRS